MANEEQKSSDMPSASSAPDKQQSGGVGPVLAEVDDVYSAFSTTTQSYLIYFLGFTMILSTLTATIYFPLIPMLSAQFRVSVQAINLTITAYAIAQALSPALFAPFADVVGRRPVLLGLVGLYAAASLGLALSRNSYPALLTLRVVQSIGGSPIPALAYGVVADVTPTAERGRMLGPMLSTCNGISALGPVIGGGVALSTSGVRWVFLALLMIAILCLLLGGFTMPETLRAIVGNGQTPPTGIWRTWWSFLQHHKSPRSAEVRMPTVSERNGWRSTNTFACFALFRYRDAAAVLWMVAMSYSIYYTFQVAIPVIFDKKYAYNELEIGLAFLPGLVGITLGGIIAGKLVDRNYALTRRKHDFSVEGNTELALGDFPIEAARYRKCLPIILAEVVLVAGYGWTVHFEVHPSVPIILQFFICGLSTLLSHTSSALLVDIFPNKSSTAYASGQVARCGMSAASAAILQPLVDAVGYGWYFTMFSVFVGLSLAASVIISRLKGAKWRQMRHNDENDRNAAVETPEILMTGQTRPVTPV